jgi:hypothetical protein
MKQCTGSTGHRGDNQHRNGPEDRDSRGVGYPAYPEPYVITSGIEVAEIAYVGIFFAGFAVVDSRRFQMVSATPR